jgi:hypothetical protein
MSIKVTLYIEDTEIKVLTMDSFKLMTTGGIRNVISADYLSRNIIQSAPRKSMIHRG